MTEYEYSMPYPRPPVVGSMITLFKGMPRFSKRMFTCLARLTSMGEEEMM
jgi:hypothetical protein